jgi:hypothetical protein
MKTYLYIVFFFLLINISLSQNSFEYLYQSPNDNWPGDMFEDVEGNIIVSFFDTQLKNTNLLKINNYGLLVNIYNYSEPNYNSTIKELIPLNDGTFIGIGVYNHDTVYNLWYCLFDLNLNLLFDHKILTEYELIYDRLNSTINDNGNIVIGATYKINEFETSVCLFELSINGDLENYIFYTPLNQGIAIFYDLFKIPNSSNYKIFTTNFFQKSIGKIYTVDSAFNILFSTPFSWYQSDNLSVKLINEEEYLLGLVRYISKDNICSGLVKHSMNENILDSLLLCNSSVINYSAWIRSVDFVDSSKIYFGSTYSLNLIDPFFSTSTSWIMLNKLDIHLLPIWQKYYGGDAYYNLWSILATQDGGCVMSGTRYDHQTQNQERDVYILKVNEDGILTWAYNFPETTKKVIVYPNPGRDEIRIKAIENNLRFDLFDINGNKILSQPIENEDKINTSQLKKGVYTYRILNQKSETVETRKWIKN